MRTRGLLAVLVGSTIALASLASCDPRVDEPARAAPPSSSAAPPPETHAIHVPGFSAEVPNAFVALEADRAKELKNASLAQQPDAHVEIAAERDPAGMGDGTAYVLRVDLPDNPALKRGTVRDVLTRATDEAKLMIELGGIQIADSETKTKDDTIVWKASGKMTRGAATLELHIAMVGYVAKDKRLSLFSVTCMQRPNTKLCDRVVESYRVDPDAHLALGESLGPPFEIPREFLGFAWGSGHEAFDAACKKNGMKKVDPSTEPPQIAEMVKSGALDECKGSAPSKYGKVIHVGGQFFDGKMGALIADLDAPPEALVEKLGEDFPGLVGADGARVIAGAKADEIFSVRAANPTILAAKGSIFFVTKSVADRAGPAARP